MGREWIAKNPAKSLRLPKAQGEPAMPFTDEEITAMLAACDEITDTRSAAHQERTQLRARALLLTLHYSGMRISDVILLEISKRTVSRYLARLHRGDGAAQLWRGLLKNHRELIAWMDFFTVIAANFRILYGFFLIRQGRREVIHFECNRAPYRGLGCATTSRSVPRKHRPPIRCLRSRREIPVAGAESRNPG